MTTAKAYPPGAYQCPACYSAYEDYEDYDAHRRITHGRDGHGVLVAPAGLYDARPTIEQRLARIEANVMRILALMEEESKP